MSESTEFTSQAARHPKYSGTVEVINGNGAVARVMNMVCGGVIGYPITPSTEISETFQNTVAQGVPNVWGAHPFFFEPEGEHSAQSGALGAALTGGKFISNASSSQGVLYGMESHFVTVGRRIGGFVLHIAARVVSRHSLNVMGGHDDVYALLPSGYTVLFGATPEEAADLALISYRTASLSLIPVANCMDGFSTSHVMSEARLPEADLVREYLGDPTGYIESPTVAQEMLYGAKGRAFQLGAFTDARVKARELSAQAGKEIHAFLDSHSSQIEQDAAGSLFDSGLAPLLLGEGLNDSQLAAWRRQWVNAPAKGMRPLLPALVDLDNPGLTGPVQNQPDFQAGVADHHTHFEADVPALARRAMAEYNELTGSDYQPIRQFMTDDADVIMVALGSISQDVQAILPYLRAHGIKAGLVQVVMLQPFPEAEFVEAIKGAKAITVLERSGQAALTSFVNTAIIHASQNARAIRYEGVPALNAGKIPDVSTGFFGIGGHDVQPRHLIAAYKAMASGSLAPEFYIGSTFFDPDASGEQAALQEQLRAAYPRTESMALDVEPNPVGLLPPEAMRIRFHSVGGYGTIATGKLLTDILAEMLQMHSKASPKYGSE
ncbi:MAG: pyruvate-flavodoxin oxidoreductase, partial [Actinomycetaceae bacterium]|nr:pyruvate-flavodoxin oxidoreductase [Actinomycetaceae bacterium]